MGRDFSWKDKLGCAALAILFWLMIPVPFWLLASGFAGGLFLPDFGLLGQGDFGINFVFSSLFYAPLLLAVLFVESAARESRLLSRNSDEYGSNR
jgi:hypothetical protein